MYVCFHRGCASVLGFQKNGKIIPRMENQPEQNGERNGNLEYVLAYRD